MTLSSTTRSPIEILLVEDDPDDLELALHAIDASPVTDRVKVIRDGAAALDFMFGRGQYARRREADHPRVVLLDLKLPKVDGFSVLEELKSDPQTRQTPVVVLSSSQETADIERCYHLGANSYIVKPVDFEQFTEALQLLEYYWLLLNEIPTQARWAESYE